MQQQINLFQFVVRRVKSFLDFKILLLIYGIIASALVFLTVIQIFLLEHQQTLVKENFARVEDKRIHLIELAKKYPNNAFATEIVDSSKLTACKTKFSTYLTGIAEAIVPGVWLTQFRISNNGNSLELNGKGYRAEQIQTYLDNLKKSKSFSGLNFSLENITEGVTSAPLPTSQETINKVITNTQTHFLSFSIVARGGDHG